MATVTSGALDGLKERHHSFFERLNALLDLCGVVKPGAGRQTWIAHHGEVTPLAVKGWEQGRRVRDGNVQTLAAAIVADLPVKCSQEELSNYLRGDRPDIDVSLELRRLGLSMPNQAWFLNLLNEEMAEQGMNPTDPALFGIWSTTAIKVLVSLGALFQTHWYDAFTLGWMAPLLPSVPAPLSDVPAGPLHCPPMAISSVSPQLQPNSVLVAPA